MSEITSLPTTRKSSSLVFFLLIIVSIISAGIGYYVAWRSMNVSKPKKTITTITSAPTIVAPSVPPVQQWVETDVAGVITFKYPFGHHVVSLWPEDFKQGLRIVISDVPYSTAPRGGDPDELYLLQKNGFENPDEEMSNHMEQFKKTVTNLKEETFQTSIGTVTNLSGDMNIFGEIAPVESYYFAVQSGTSTDLINKNLFSSFMLKNSANAKILRTIIESVKKK